MKLAQFILSTTISRFLKIILLVFALIMIANNSVQGQTDISYVEIRLKNGNEIIAELIAIEKEYLEINLIKDSLRNNEKIYFSDITRYTIRGYKWYERNHNRDTTRFTARALKSSNLLGFAAYDLKKGQLYYQNIFLFGHYGGYKVTDRFLIEGGAEIFSVLITPHDYEDYSNIKKLPAMLLAAKYTIVKNINHFDVHIGGLSLRAPYSEQLISASAMFGEVTYRRKKFDLSFGMGIVPKDNVIGKQPLILASGSFRIGKRTSIITTNWIYRNDGNLFVYNTIGVKCELKKVTFDFALTRIKRTELRGGISSFDGIINPRMFSITFPISK